MRYWFLLAGIILLLITSCESKIKDTNTPKSDGVSAIDSVEYLTDLIRADSTDYTLFRRRARNYLDLGQIDPAFRDISLAIDLKPDDSQLFIMLGDVYFLIGKVENCIDAFKKASRLDPDSDRPFLKLAEIYLIIQKYKLALQYTDFAISKNLNSADAYFLKGITYLEMQDTASSLINLKIAGNLDSLNYPAFMQTASILSALNDTSALDYYNAALKVVPNDERALFLIAVTRQDMEEYGLALDLYKEIIEMYPTNKFALYNSGYIQMVIIQDYEKAIRLFQDAIAIDPSYVDAVFNLGRCYEAIGKFDEARAQYKQAMVLEPNYPLAIEGLNRLDDVR